MNGAVSLDPASALMVAHDVDHLDEIVDVDEPGGQNSHPLARQLYVAHLALEYGDTDHAAQMFRRAAGALDDVDDVQDSPEVGADV